ncbi:MAG: hypothetical protein HQM09_02495 [Candidatus Riflebacteria bacterium]|nr:hypothetical protein [Candidatus Riflebacteria bacterium]
MYFADRQLFNGIPIFARDPSGIVVAATRTTTGGDFSFSSVPAGIYDLAAVTGDAEVIFSRSVSLTPEVAKRLPEVSLLCLQNVLVDRVTSSSFHIAFQSNLPATSMITFGTNPDRFPVSTALTTTHQVELPGLSSGMNYPVSIFLNDAAGQSFTHSGINVVTLSTSAGPQRLSVAIENGEYETRNPQATVYLKAVNAADMRVGLDYQLSDAKWESFATTKAVTLPGNDGTKRVYAQFRGSSIESPIINDSILLTTDTKGYLGVWIEGGAAQTSNSQVWLTLLYPGAMQMMLSPTMDFTSSFWETYTQSRQWTLSSGEGVKNVYAKFNGPGIDSSQVFSSGISFVFPSVPTGTSTATGTSTGTGTATGTSPTPTPQPSPDETGPFELVIGATSVPRLNHPEEIITSTDVLLEGDSRTFYAEFRNANTGKVLEKSFRWFVFSTEGGSDVWGKIDASQAKYTSPDTLPPGGDSIDVSAQTFNSYLDEATGKSHPYAATVTVHLKPFWVERSDGMKRVDGSKMSIYSILVDPIWAEGADYYLFAGTNGNGLYWARVTSTVDSAPIVWQKSVLSSEGLVNPPTHVVNKLAINGKNGDIAMATENGLFIVGGGTRSYDTKFVQMASGTVKSVAWDLANPHYLYASRDDGIERLELSSDWQAVVNSIPLYLGGYRSFEKRTDTTASPPLDVWAYSFNLSYVFQGAMRSLGLSIADPNVLYVGTDNGILGLVEHSQTAISPLRILHNQPFFTSTAGVGVAVGDVTILDNSIPFETVGNSVVNPPPIPLITDISIDPNSPWTLLVATSRGIFRSIDKGVNFTQLSNKTNTRGALIDPTNVTHFFFGAEDGLYRSKDAGSTWKTLKTGLNDNSVINCFTQSSGAPGANRRIWIGTTGGVFVGAKSLDLY